MVPVKCMGKGYPGREFSVTKVVFFHQGAKIDCVAAVDVIFNVGKNAILFMCDSFVSA